MNNNYGRTLLMAVALLTRIPVAQWLPQQWDDKDLGMSALWYPVVGVMITVLLLVTIWILPLGISPWVAAIVLVAVWVLMTGALHLDGLADCVDAIYAGHSVVEVKAGQGQDKEQDNNPRREKILTVLKDPSAGAMAVIALIIVLLFKVILVASLWPNVGLSVLAAIVMARTAALLFMISTPYTPYARSAGLGLVITRYVSKQAAIVVGLSVLLIAFLLLPLTSFLVVLFGIFAVGFIWRRYWIKTIGGFVGDAVGALIEVVEVMVLLLLYCAAL